MEHVLPNIYDLHKPTTITETAQLLIVCSQFPSSCGCTLLYLGGLVCTTSHSYLVLLLDYAVLIPPTCPHVFRWLGLSASSRSLHLAV